MSTRSGVALGACSLIRRSSGCTTGRPDYVDTSFGAVTALAESTRGLPASLDRGPACPAALRYRPLPVERAESTRRRRRRFHRREASGRKTCDDDLTSRRSAQRSEELAQL